MRRKLLLFAMSLTLLGCASSESKENKDTSAPVSESVTTQDPEKESTGSETAAPTAGTETKDETKTPESETHAETETDAPAEKEPVAFSLAGGVYPVDTKVELSAPAGSTIYYTLDGSDPRTSDTRLAYESPVAIEDLSGKENVIAAVDPGLYDTAHCKYERKTKSLKCNLDTPSTEAVDKCTVIKAVYEDSEGFSPLYSQAYFTGSIEDHVEGIAKACEASGTSLAVISITMNFDDLFDYENGIYVKGKLFDEAWEEYISDRSNRIQDDSGRKLLSNYNSRGREWEREAYMDMYEYTPSGTANVLSQSCGIRIQGNYSRSDAQKGFRLYARNDYGDKRFRYAVFGDSLTDIDGKTIDTFKTLILRNGGNCAFTTKFSDAYWQSLIEDMAVSTMATRPAVVYLNGEYFGLYVLEEDYSEEYFEDHYNVKSDDVVLYKGDAERYESGYKLDLGEIPDGEKEDYYFKDLKNFFKKNGESWDDATVSEFAKLVDIDSVRDYFAIQVWINNKWDWPGKNWSMWKTKSAGEGYGDGRWRLTIYDVEFGGVSGAGDATINTVKEDNYKPLGLLDFDTNNVHVLCFAHLMTNAGFRKDFYDALNKLSDETFAYEKADTKLKEFEDVYGALLDQFFERYPGTGSTKEALNGGYASSKCIRDFLKKRAANIQKIIDYCEKTRG